MLWEHPVAEPLVTRHGQVMRRAMIQVAMCLPTARPAPFSSFLEHVSGVLVRTRHVVLRCETSQLVSPPSLGTCDDRHGTSCAISGLNLQPLSPPAKTADIILFSQRRLDSTESVQCR